MPQNNDKTVYLENGAEMTIHTYGDSHAIAGWNRLTDYKVVTHHLGARLMYSLARSGINVLSYDKEDLIVFCCGEIDCRCHIYKQSKEKSYQQVIDVVVKNYIAMIKKLELHCKVAIYSVVPPLKIVPSYAPELEIDLDVYASNHPFLGTEQERLSYVLCMNKKLKAMCTPDFLFIDIYSYYATSEGFIDSKLSDGGVHIKDLKGLQLALEEVLK